MGIYIKGMEMPTEKKSITIFPDGRVYENHGDRLWGQGKDCIPWKAVPVPAHGRLGDLDALCESKDVLDDVGWPDAFLPISTIEAAPTVIPAEEGET